MWNDAYVIVIYEKMCVEKLTTNIFELLIVVGFESVLKGLV